MEQTLRQRAEALLELARKATDGPWFSGIRGGRCHINHKHGYGDCVYDLVLYPNDHWFEATAENVEIWEYDYEDSKLKNPADTKFIVASRSETPYLAQKLIEALDVLKALDNRGGLGLEWHKLIREFLEKASE